MVSVCGVCVSLPVVYVYMHVCVYVPVVCGVCVTVYVYMHVWCTMFLALTTDTLGETELEEITKRVLIETVGISSNTARITFLEFEQVLSRALDFNNLFRFTV